VLEDRRRVLVVDDDPQLRELLQDVLADEGYVVQSANHGAAALDVLGTWHPDVILLDLMMPVMDGMSFRAEQRRRELALEVPIVVLSAAREARLTAMALGATATLAKPFDLAELLDTVERAVRRV
jgi:CheY-like chemotaxis protein